MKTNVEVFSVNRSLPPISNGVPVPERVIVLAVPPSSVALAVTESVPATVMLGVVPATVVVNVVAASPMVKLPNVSVPGVPTQLAPLLPIQFVPEAEPSTVVVPVELCVNVCPLATLMLPEFVTLVLPTVSAFVPKLNVPALTSTWFLASVATPAVNVWLELLIVKL